MSKSLQGPLALAVLLSGLIASPAAGWRVCIQKGNGLLMWVDYGTRQIWMETDLAGGG